MSLYDRNYGQPSFTDTLYYSSGVQTVIDITFPIAPSMTWDGYMRLLYDRSNQAIQQQANILLQRGNIQPMEVRALVESSRNSLVTNFRNRLSPFGRLYSEILKPGQSLPTLETMLQKKGTLEAVLESVGKSRVVVNRIAAVSRFAGPAVIIVQITLSAVVIYAAEPAERGRVTARELSGIGGATAGGVSGMWAGCATFAMLASPSLVIPIVGEVTTSGACIVGGILVGAGGGYLGFLLGREGGEATYDFVTKFHWSGA